MADSLIASMYIERIFERVDGDIIEAGYEIFRRIHSSRGFCGDQEHFDPVAGGKEHGLTDDRKVSEGVEGHSGLVRSKRDTLSNVDRRCFMI